MGYDWEKFNRALTPRGPLDMGSPLYGTIYDRKSQTANDRKQADLSEVRGQTLDYDLDPEKILSNMPGRGLMGGAKTGKGEGLVFDLDNNSALREYAKKHGIVRIEDDGDGNITTYHKNQQSARKFNELKVASMEDLVNNKEMTYANRGDDTFVSTAEDRLRNKTASKKKSEKFDAEDLYKQIILRGLPPAFGTPEFEEYKKYQFELEELRQRNRERDLGIATDRARKKGATNTVASILKALL